MTDELLMRRWNASHAEFSSDLSRGLLRLGHFLSRRARRPQAIGKAYTSAITKGSQVDIEMSARARAALAGVLACVATSALLVTVAALASAGAGHAAVIHHTMAAGPAIVPHAYLA